MVVEASGLLPRCDEGSKHLEVGIFLARGLHGVHRIFLSEPNKRRPNRVRPFLERGQWRHGIGLLGCEPPHDDCHARRDVFAAVGQDGCDGIPAKFALLRSLHVGVEGAHDDATNDVAGRLDIVAGSEHRGVGLDLIELARPQGAHRDDFLRDELAQIVAAERAVQIVDRDDRIALQQGAAETLLGFLLGAARRQSRDKAGRSP